ncbi:MAG: BMP family lipoprotein [Actinomycetes bacterium]
MTREGPTGLDDLLRDAYGAAGPRTVAPVPDLDRLHRRLAQSQRREHRLAAVVATLALLMAIAVPTLAIVGHRRDALPARGGPLDVAVVAGPVVPGPGSYAWPVRAQVDRFTRSHGTRSQWFTVRGDGSEEIEQAASSFRTVILVGGRYQAVATRAAGRHPHTHFFLVDANGGKLPHNMSGVAFSRVTSSYVAGAVAAEASANGHVGVVFAEKTSVTTTIADAFKAGATAERPGVQISATFPSNGEAGVTTAAIAQLSGGADVVLGDPAALTAVADARGHGHRAWYIGFDADYGASAPRTQRAFVLTSVVPRLDLFTRAALQAVAAGSPSSLGSFVGGTSDVVLTTTGGHLARYSKAITVDASGAYPLQQIDGSPFPERH